jgi:hypothetical protein
MIAHGIDQGPQSFRLSDSVLFAHEGQHADESLLPDVFDGFLGVQP